MNDEEKKAHDEAVARAREANSTRNTERLKLMEQIADGTDEARAADFQDDSEDTEARAAREEKEAAELMAKGLQEEGVEPQEEEADTRVTNGETFYRQVINGQEKWQTLKQIRETASKVEAADEYLRTAAESVKNASRLALSTKDEPSNVERVDVRAILRAAVMGEEEAIEKLASVLETRPSEVTPDVVRQIDQRLSFRTELAGLEEKSKDLLENPYTKRLFRDRLQEMRAENPNMGLSEAYTSIDKELRTAFPGLTKARTQDKLERKKTLVNVPTAASRQLAEEEPEGEEDVSSVIEKMAKARGLSPIVHASNRRER
jgi:hypothetical protein